MMNFTVLLIQGFWGVFFQTSFSTLHGARNNVPHIIVHITDGPSTDPTLLLQEAENAHNQGIAIFNIGVGEGVELNHLAKVFFFSYREYYLLWWQKEEEQVKNMTILLIQ